MSPAYKIELTEKEIETIIGWGGVRSVEWDLSEDELDLWLRLKRLIGDTD